MIELPEGTTPSDRTRPKPRRLATSLAWAASGPLLFIGFVPQWA